MKLLVIIWIKSTKLKTIKPLYQKLANIYRSKARLDTQVNLYNILALAIVLYLDLYKRERNKEDSEH